MSEERIPKVVNTHHFGGIEKLPSDTIYIGRPSPYGNAYSSHTGKYTKEECIALHRIDLYRSLIADPGKLMQLHKELGGRDLACWCKQAKSVVGCHGDNYLYILSPHVADRAYTKSVIGYLMEDLRYALQAFHNWVLHEVSADDFLKLALYDEEVRAEIKHVILLCRKWETPIYAVEYLLARILVDLELANQDKNVEMVKYRIDHACWVIWHFCQNRQDRDREPLPPHLKTLRKPKKKTKE